MGARCSPPALHIAHFFVNYVTAMLADGSKLSLYNMIACRFATAHCGILLLRIRRRAGHAKLANSTVTPNAITVRESLRSAVRSDA
mgnify:CR=1 FL=1